MAPDEIRRFDGIVRDAFMSIRIVDGKRIFFMFSQWCCETDYFLLHPQKLFEP